MTMSKMALLGAVVVASVVIGSGTLAWVRNGAVTADLRMPTIMSSDRTAD